MPLQEGWVEAKVTGSSPRPSWKYLAATQYIRTKVRPAADGHSFTTSTLMATGTLSALLTRIWLSWQSAIYAWPTEQVSVYKDSFQSLSGVVSQFTIVSPDLAGDLDALDLYSRHCHEQFPMQVEESLREKLKAMREDMATLRRLVQGWLFTLFYQNQSPDNVLVIGDNGENVVPPLLPFESWVDKKMDTRTRRIVQLSKKVFKTIPTFIEACRVWIVANSSFRIVFHASMQSCATLRAEQEVPNRREKLLEAREANRITVLISSALRDDKRESRPTLLALLVPFTLIADLHSQHLKSITRTCPASMENCKRRRSFLDMTMAM